MNAAPDLFEAELEGDTLVLTPEAGLLGPGGWRAEEDLLWLADDPSARDVVVDLGHTARLGSAALGLLTRLWRQVRGRGGRMALCNVSPQGREVLAVTGLAGFWPAYPSREEAVGALAD